MNALAIADRFGLRCADPRHPGFGAVFMTCDDRGRLATYAVETPVFGCFELVERVAEDVWEVPADV